MASNNTPAYVPKWTVTGTNPRTSVIGGQPVEGHLVSFVTDKQNRSQIFIPNTVTDLTTVRDMIAQQVSFVDGIAGLTG